MSAVVKALSYILTDKQREAIKLINSVAIFVFLYGGSRSAKTFTILRTIVTRAVLVPKSRHLVVRFRFNHVKSAIIFDTFPKMMDICFPDIPYHLDKSDWFAVLPNGSEIWFGGLDDKDRMEKVLGNEYCTILLNEASQVSYNGFLILITRLAQKCMFKLPDSDEESELALKFFVDENPPSKGHWTYKLFIEGKDPISGKSLEYPDDYTSLLMNPRDNLANLPAAYIRQLQAMPKRKKDRFWHGKFGDEGENALWTAELIEKHTINAIPEEVNLVRIVVAVDPSGASDDENENNDDIGIGVAALGSDGIGYVLEDLTIHAGPAKWGKVAASAYERHEADRLIGEENFGGAMVEFVVKTANPNISYKSVRASRGKTIRAEPVSALHETGKVKFVGNFDKLEDELTGFTTTGYIGEKSPNRADWFIWAMTELFPGMTKKDAKPEPDISIPNLKRL